MLRRTSKFKSFHNKKLSSSNPNLTGVNRPTLPESAEVVVIGGGTAGCNTLYHLARRGVNAVLVERGKLTSGTTWHTAGTAWSLRPSDVDIQLLKATKDMFPKLQQETGLDPGWIQCGGFFMSHNEARTEEYSRLSTIGKAFGIESHMLSPEEAKEIFPLLNAKCLHRVLHSPADGSIDPTQLCAALKKASIINGAKIFEDCPVIDIETNDDQLSGSKTVQSVVTPHGSIKTNCVINCSGAWSREIANLVDLDLPMIPIKHSYVVTNSIPGARNMPNIRDHDFNIYFRGQGEAICMGGYEKNPELMDKVEKNFQFQLYELDWTTVEEHVKNSIELIPAFGEAGIKSTVCGPESFTPDHKPILGEDPRLHGLYHNCGHNSAGMMFGGGYGEQMAQWVITGRPELPMHNYDIRRFLPASLKNKQWIKERCHESYATLYSVVYPHEQPLAGRNLITDPLHEILVYSGAMMEEKHGWERPAYFKLDGAVPIAPYDWYGSYGHKRNKIRLYEEQLKNDYSFSFPQHQDLIRQEAMACRTKAAVFDLSYYNKLYLSGPDAQQAANWLFSADTTSARNGTRTVYSCALNERGGVETDVTVTPQQDGPIISCGDLRTQGRGFYIVACGSSGYQTWSHINSVLQKNNFRVQLNDVSDKIGVISLQGPNSREILKSITATDVTDEALPAFESKLISIDDHTCMAIRISFVGEMGYQLHTTNDSCLAVYRRITDVGKRYGLRNAGFRALYSLGCEKGHHLWNYDLRTDDTPIEANLGHTCRTVGEYLGKSVIEKQRVEGVRKKIAFFTMSNDDVPLWGLETVWRNGEIVGYIRRGEYAFALDRNVGIGYVKHPDNKLVSDEFLTSGEYEIEALGKKYPARAFLRSPFDPENHRIAGKYEDKEDDDTLVHE